MTPAIGHRHHRGRADIIIEIGELLSLFNINYNFCYSSGTVGDAMGASYVLTCSNIIIVFDSKTGEVFLKDGAEQFGQNILTVGLSAGWVSLFCHIVNMRQGRDHQGPPGRHNHPEPGRGRTSLSLSTVITFTSSHWQFEARCEIFFYFRRRYSEMCRSS